MSHRKVSSRFSGSGLNKRVLIICEKPSSAKKISQALDEQGRPETHQDGSVTYFISRRKGSELIVVSALGHLYTITQHGKGWSYPILKFEWVPIHFVKPNIKTKNCIDAIAKLSQKIDSYISACDYDIEGSLIAYNILLHICGIESLKKSKRMKYSTLTEADLIEAWENMSPSLDYPIIEAGKARHEIDWIFGINLSRALTLSIKNILGIYKTLSIGRVQGPTLKFIEERETKIQTHIPIPYWIIEAKAEIDGKEYRLMFERETIEAEKEALDIESSCKGREGIIKEIRRSRKMLPPPHPFNLGDLQQEAYYQLRMSPTTVLRVAEKLYLDALISYPRTSSQKLPSSINIRQILSGLSMKKDYYEHALNLLNKPSLAPRNGLKEDPAHPAIYPTGNLPGSLKILEYKIFDLISRRFMSTFEDPAIKEDIMVLIDVNGYSFHLKNSKIVEPNWIKIYKPYFKVKEERLPPLREGQVLKITKLRALKQYSKPPLRLNHGSLLRMMEKENIGTKATRAEIIDILLKRGYVEGNPFKITDLGISIVETLSKYCPAILSVETTRSLEMDLENIQYERKNSDEVVNKAIEYLKPILLEIKGNERAFGEELGQALLELAKKENTIGSCPTCNTGQIIILKNHRTGKRFAGCSNYQNGSCATSYPLPQKGRIEPIGRTCPVCGAPMIKVSLKGKKDWVFCLNINCPTKRKNRNEK
ncbi:MAG: DNA topoisomerase I [Candidatus Bathyarchaeia archaeon]